MTDTTEAIQAERTRMRAILTPENLRTCPDMAKHLAFETSMAAPAAIEMLAMATKGPSADVLPMRRPPYGGGAR